MLGASKSVSSITASESLAGPSVDSSPVTVDVCTSLRGWALSGVETGTTCTINLCLCGASHAIESWNKNHSITAKSCLYSAH